ncbi:MAG: hypothetical protein A2940_01170 [Candidatus Wildermuthbacteria bacterium RIFCSPLOWO2_01_FULL_48_29]|uniref:Uncharacterized protein n=2 Tax=Candidatus Wildermuthiibacteriota TaxID=1817923 RepID=A0A1G2RLS2_9BACT|nr:MAG: hypothetical protein A2843_01280 [Candidatus Wildermuthbacteria bacterium RIFCSPHIGHO2_01_FULL_48_27b]OHA73319.1 MAG: hypothetical protein A2940_01170 [Candidatus Wildermuthbacteria bacterium RIFCSPLOWO2_01_FULL_48_29]
MSTGVFFLVLCLLTAVGVGGVIAIVTWAERHPSFRTVFGFKPSTRGSRLRTAEQKRVEGQLSALAIDYAAWDAAERRAPNSPSGQFKRWHEQERRRLANVRRALEAAKARFWRAHGLAAKKEFSVCNKYTDYLQNATHR